MHSFVPWWKPRLPLVLMFAAWVSLAGSTLMYAPPAFAERGSDTTGSATTNGNEAEGQGDEDPQHPGRRPTSGLNGFKLPVNPSGAKTSGVQSTRQTLSPAQAWMAELAIRLVLSLR